MFGCLQPVAKDDDYSTQTSDRPPVHRRQRPQLAHGGQPQIVISRRRNSAFESVPRESRESVQNRRGSVGGGGMRRLDNWISHLLREGVSKNSSSNQNSSVEQRAGEWKYADDVKVTIAPLASSEIDDSSHHSRMQRDRDNGTRASTVLQNLREQKEHLDYAERRRQMQSPIQSMHQSIGPSLPMGSLPPTGGSMNQSMHAGNRPLSPHGPPPISNGRRSVEPMQQPIRRELDDMNVVFLQANDEVKRILLPPRVDAIEQVKMAFVRSFPHITRGYIEQPQVKIYIQEQSKGQLFYELEDLRDIKNKSVLRLREHQMNGVASPVRFLEQPDYHSETEFDDGRNRFISLARPASAMAHPMGGGSGRGKSFDPYYDPYSSDASDSRSNSVIRSGSVTPIIDREARVRMETMERQLAGLSSLVHTALTSKGMTETTQRDMAALRKEIFALHPETDVRASSEEPPSLPDSISSQTHQELYNLKQRVNQAGTECRQLRRTAQVNAQQSRQLIRDAGDEISRIVSEKIGKSGDGQSVRPIVTENSEPAHEEREEHNRKIQNLLENLTTFEHNVESVRNCVLNANRKLRMSEVEQLTEELTQIGRNAAAIKTNFPTVQQKIEARIKADMERIVREEKYIRDETTAVDQSLRRCKALANIMVTMKKLAMVQDPSLHRSSSRASKQDPSTSATLPPPVPTPPRGELSHPSQPPTTAEMVPPPPVPPAPEVYRRATEQQKTATALLDSVIDDISSLPPPVPNGQPPRPPSRTAVSDVRAKFKQPPELPEQIRSLMEDVRRGSPNPESLSTSTPVSERRANLEERQKELAEKQRQLRSQFQQLQTLTPIP